MEYIENEVKSKQFLVFLLGGKSYGVPILRIDGIIGIPNITPLPKTPEYVSGVIDLRGQIIPVIDLRCSLGMPKIEYTEQSCIVVIKFQLKNSEKLVGFLVDVVSEVFDIQSSDIENPPSYGFEADEDVITGIGKCKGQIVMLLDIDNLFGKGDVSHIASQISESNLVVSE